MIIIMKPQATEEQIGSLCQDLSRQGMQVQRNAGVDCTVLGVLGDVAKLDPHDFLIQPGVERVMPVSEPFKKANRKFHPTDSVIDCGGVKIGGKEKIAVMAGPCSIESEEQALRIAQGVKAGGATLFRGGAYKPRTSPYSFQGMKAEGLELLSEAKKKTGLPIVTEIMSIGHLDLFEDVDVIQVGARNMQNFEMLAEIGKCRKPILLKRGLANTIEEWLMSAEYIMSGGNENVILCERGIRTFETATRNTFDVSAIPVLHNLTHLPVIADPSHASGKSSLIKPLAKSAVAAGADGLMIEVHPEPSKALCHGAQSLTPDAFDDVMTDVKKLCEFENKTL